MTKALAEACRCRSRRRRADKAASISPAAQPRECAVRAARAPARSRDRGRRRATPPCRTLNPFQPRAPCRFAGKLRQRPGWRGRLPRAAPPAPGSASDSWHLEHLGEFMRAVSRSAAPAARRRDLDRDRSGRRRPDQPDLEPPGSQRLRIRALTSAASTRGLVPIRRKASACSMPAMSVLKI